MRDMTEFDWNRQMTCRESEAIDELRRKQRRRWFWRGVRRRLLEAAIILLAASVIPLAVLLREMFGR